GVKHVIPPPTGPSSLQHSWPAMHPGMHGAALHPPPLPSQYGVAPVHLIPQPPQLSGSLSVLTHCPKQHIRPVWQLHPLWLESAPASWLVVDPPHATAANRRKKTNL